MTSLPSDEESDGGSDMKRRSEKQPTAAAPLGPVAESNSENSNPSQDEIALLAYSFWEARGRQDGSPEKDWLKAEQELQGFKK